MKTKTFLLTIAATLAFAACSKEDTGAEPGGNPGTQGGEIRFEIGFAPEDGAGMQARSQDGTLPSGGDAPQTRVATDTQFKSTWEDGDAIGIFAVKHGTQLAAADNPIHNVKLTYSSADGKWTSDEPLYWPAGRAKYDFYAYYPYNAASTNPTAIAFNVHTDQSATTTADGSAPKSNYNLSDLLTAKSTGATTTSADGWARGETVSLTFRHALAMVQVSVGRSMLGDYDPDDLRVRLNGCAASTVLDLTAGQTEAPTTGDTDATPITMYPCPNDGGAPGTFAYRALVPAQAIARGTVLFRFEHGGSTLLTSRPLADALALTAGETERFDISFPFTSATVSATERLADLLTEDKRAAVTHLKVSGEMAAEDFETIRDKMTALTSLDLGGATVQGNEIPAYALYSKLGLKEFVFPRNIVAIGEQAFRDCSGLTGSLTIPAGVTTIGTSAFEGCRGFTGSLTIPAGVTTIGEWAFYNCRGFTGSLTIPAGVTTIGESAFKDCRGFTGSLTIPAGVTTIGEGAFWGCKGFKGSLTISEGVTTIGKSAFNGCIGFTGSLTIPAGVTTIGEGAFRGCSGFTGSLTIPEGVTTIGDIAFYGCSGFTGSLTIPAGITTIGNSAFYGCIGFTGSLTIPASITTIGNYAFLDCSGFTGSLTIPTSVTTIGNSAFAGCSGFTGSLTIPASITTIGNYAFADCIGFTGSLTIPASVKTIGEGTFLGCSGFTGSLTIPAGITTIGESAFSGCSGFNGSLTIPAGVKKIDKSAFAGCSSFTGSLTIPEGVTTIGENAFRNCSGFTGSLTIPAGVTTISDCAFADCSGFTGSLTIPAGVTMIGGFAFQNCKGFTGSLTIPAGVTTIGNWAFYECTQLSSITCHIPDPKKVIYGSNVFMSVPTGIPVSVPAGSETDYKKHAAWKQFTDIRAISQP